MEAKTKKQNKKKMITKTKSENFEINPVASTSKIVEENAPIEVPIIEGVKHPLENTWGFWMFTNNKQNWEENLVKLTAFNTVEDYWCLYHHMKTPTELNLGQDYAIFKNEIRPMWEDAANKKGGRWLVNLDKQKNNLDWMWLEMVLLMIGENFENNDDVCGVVVNLRFKPKIAIWTADAKNKNAIEEIGKKFKETIGNLKISFQVHDSSKNLYTI